MRYRLRQLEKLFGDRLRAPESRFALSVALHARYAVAARQDRRRGPGAGPPPLRRPGAAPQRRLRAAGDR
ncbi:helix-turn-helix domain-containing protein [Streptomyces sp. NPDC088400]|uniref:helix-turn-helix domain-containing protein n=1 Tax=Streptomyces sp. NPDC088400 TaxID=3365861 RepID=UPI003829C8CA